MPGDLPDCYKVYKRTRYHINRGLSDDSYWLFDNKDRFIDFFNDKESALRAAWEDFMEKNDQGAQ